MRIAAVLVPFGRSLKRASTGPVNGDPLRLRATGT